jgi:hypothetical protein
MFSCTGQADEAIRWLETAFQEHSPYLSTLNVERWFDGIRTDPRFVSLLGRVGLVQRVTAPGNTQTTTMEGKADRLSSNLLRSGYHRVEDKLSVVLGENVSFRLIAYNEDSSEYIVCDYCEQATKSTVEGFVEKLKLLSRSNFDYKVRLGVLLSDVEPASDVKEYVNKLPGTKYTLHVVSDPDKVSEHVP